MDRVLNPHIVAREIIRLISLIADRKNIKAKAYGEAEWARYDGVLCNIRSYKNDANFYFDIYFECHNFTISLPMFDESWNWSIANFAEYKIIPLLYQKLDNCGYATWD